MNMKARIILMICCLMCLTGLADNSLAENPSGRYSEGIYTPCDVRYDNHSFYLSEGDQIAVIAPSKLASREKIASIVQGLKSWGYEPVEGKHVSDERRTLDDCLEDLIWALEDPEIRAIFCACGGYGASEVMDMIGTDLISSSNKIIIGYSDITVFHSAWTVAGLPSIHGAMSEVFAGDLQQTWIETEKNILRGKIPTYTCQNDLWYKKGMAEGILIGGNLSTFISVLNTDYDCTRSGQPYILFLEEVGESIQHIHRYLTVLDHMGILDQAAGIVFGEWTNMPSIWESGYDGSSRGGGFESVADMIMKEFFSEREIPVAFGFPAGHGEENYPLLMGRKARLTVEDHHFTLEWIQ